MNLVYLLYLVILSNYVTAQWTLNLIDLNTYPLARCLDGTPGGYYISPGTGDDAANILWHTQGGAWIISDEDAANRAKSPLGSSSFWATTGCPNANSPVCYADGGASGMLSNDPIGNPHLANWTKIFINYCDGTSYASDVIEPVTVGTQTLYFRGYYILEAIFTDLFVKQGLAEKTKTLVVAGCSAGGLAAYIHVDNICNKVNTLNPSIRCLGAPGAGFFMGEAPPFSGNGFLSSFQWVFSRTNISTHTNDACIANHTAGDKAFWKCFIAPEVLPFIKTPIFVSNSLSDSWQAGNIMGLQCQPSKTSNCSPQQIAYLLTFRTNMLTALGPVISPNSQHGGFLQGCFVHVVEDVNQWTTVLINNRSQSDTFWSWLNDDKTNPSIQIGSFPPDSNPTC